MRGLARLVPVVLSITFGLAGCAAPHAPGVLVRLYDVGQDLHALPEVAADQRPNVVRVLPVIDLSSEGGEFEPLRERFVTEIAAYLRVAAAGTYAFRLISDDGARLWIDRRLVVDHDGLHSATPKDGPCELTAGEHALRILHFQGGGGASVKLEWRVPGALEGQFEAVPAGMLTHAADAARETSPGQKQVIAALRRGRPGDGRPLDTPHPSAASDGPEWAANTAIEQYLRDGRFRAMHAPPRKPRGPIVAWLPDDEGQSVYESGYVVSDKPQEGDFLVRRALGRWTGDPDTEAFRGHGIVQAIGGESKRVVIQGIFQPFKDQPGTALASQGCVFRFGTSVSERRASARAAFEMLNVWALKNGLEIEFTRPLAADLGWDPECYYVEQWPFSPDGRTPPARDGVAYPVKSASVSADRLRVFVEVEGLRPERVVYVRLLPPILSEKGELPRSTEAWLTLQRFVDELGEVRTPPEKPPQNVLTDEEREEGWELLFDGQTLAGWRGFKKEAPPAGWQVRDGCIVRVGPGGDLMTEGEYDNFELKLEWRISPAGNSGIFFRVSEAEPFKWPWETGPEMQVLDNAEHADGRNPLTSAGSNYALHAPARDVTRPVGLFNAVRIVADGEHIEYWLNDTQVVQYEIGGKEWEALVAGSKFSKMPHYGRMPKGHVVVQDHGDKVWYRNIKIRRLEAGEAK